MTATTLKKHISFLTSPQGQTTGVLIDLKNKAMKDFWEDFLDLLAVQERLNDERVDFFAATDKILANKK